MFLAIKRTAPYPMENEAAVPEWGLGGTVWTKSLDHPSKAVVLPRSVSALSLIPLPEKQ
jgi:hypothetical protein